MDSGVFGRARALPARGIAWLLEKGRWRVPLILALLAAAARLGLYPSRTYLFLLILGTGGLLIIGQDVRLLFLAFPAVAVFLPFQINTGTDVSLNMAVFGAVGLIGLAFIQKLLRRDASLAPSRLNRPLLAFSAVAVFALLFGNVMWSVNVPRSSNFLLVQLGQLAIYYLSFLMFWLTANVMKDLLWLRRLAYALVGAGALGAVAVLFLNFIPFVRSFRPAAMHNMLTVWVVGLSVALAAYDTHLKRAHKSYLILACALTTLASLITWLIKGDWVGGWLPPLLALSFVLWFVVPKARVYIVIILLLTLLFFGPAAILEFFDVNFQQKWDISGGSRVALWRSVIALTAPRPVLGLGIAAYRHYHFLKPLVYRTTLWVRPTVSAHNMFIDLFAQTGILGVGCYVWFLIEAILLAWRMYRQRTGFAKGYALAAFAALIAIMAADMLAETSLPFVYNLGFFGFRTSVLSWMLLGGLVVLENQPECAAPVSGIEAPLHALAGSLGQEPASEYDFELKIGGLYEAR